MKRFPLVLVLLVSGCDSGTPAKPPPPPPPEIPALPEFAVGRAHLIDTQRFDAIEAEPVGLAWNLAKDAKHGYQIKFMSSTRVAQHPVGAPAVFVDEEIHADGPFGVDGRAPEPSLARYRVHAVSGEIRAGNDKHAYTAEQIKAQPSTSIEFEIAPDGAASRMRVISGKAPRFLEALFGLPSGLKKPGDSVETALDSPATTTDEGHKGRLVTKFTGWHRIERRECVRLEADYDIEILPPPGAAMKCRMKGRVVRYFCPAEGRFVVIESAISTVYRSRIFGPQEKGPDTWGLVIRDTDAQLSVRLRE